MAQGCDDRKGMVGKWMNYEYFFVKLRFLSDLIAVAINKSYRDMVFKEEFVISLKHKLKIRIMKKVLLFFVVVCFSMTQLLAQESTFVKGEKVANFGLGLGSSLSYGNTAVPPLSASFEVGVVDNVIEKGTIGVGGYLGFSSYNWLGYKLTNIIIGPRGTFHYPLVDKLDTYAGLMIGYNIYSDNSEFTTLGSGGLVSSWFLGGRYYFSEKLAGMLELGYGVFNINLGIGLKF